MRSGSKRVSRMNPGFSIWATALLAMTSLVLPTAVSAVPVPTVSGTFNGSTWTATSLVVGVTSTATIATGGDPLYVAHMPQPRLARKSPVA